MVDVECAVQLYKIASYKNNSYYKFVLLVPEENSENLGHYGLYKSNEL